MSPDRSGRDDRSGRGQRGRAGRDAERPARPVRPARSDAPARSDHSRRIVHGIHPVRELLRAGRPVQEVVVALTRGQGGAVEEIVALAAAAGVAVRRTDADELERLAPGAVHQGVVAIAPPFPLVDVDRLLAHAAASGRPALFVAVDGVTDPHNLGSIARSAEAVGAHGLILPDRRSAPVTPVVEKAAAGALAHLPVAGVTNLVRALEGLGRAGVWSIGLDGEADVMLEGHPLAAGPVVLVVGAEGGGLSRLVRERCDVLVRLPMHGRVGSLNASVAAGVGLYTLLSARDRSA
jgi:23S rRNA (guanosine2251-2'-O)-methyltransferase